MGEIIPLKKNKIRPRLKKQFRQTQNKSNILIKHSLMQNEITYWCRKCGEEITNGNRLYCPACHAFLSDRLADNDDPNWWPWPLMKISWSTSKKEEQTKMSNILENLAPTYQKTLRMINKEIRESKDLDSNLIKALADLTRAYLQLQGKESDPDLNGNPDYYNKMLKDAQAAARPQKKRKSTKRKLIKRKSIWKRLIKISVSSSNRSLTFLWVIFHLHPNDNNEISSMVSQIFSCTG